MQGLLALAAATLVEVLRLSLPVLANWAIVKFYGRLVLNVEC
ncbi:hypothetical protein AEST_02920 [Alishewanella aestuarii B11]|uniref:Uncharacterized protein n=1 Tax=Alishewanella aestuarii B11 TaxID=1197174 RepID=J1QMA4_9ALTE|nr:hypothetical protein AEST_02920 [Alishewanella aestuarii B11]